MKNYSKQREAIITVLRDMKTHPTANAVYERVKEIIPNISLGTVYRNLAALRESGDILAISIGDGFDHFDGDMTPHIHLHCRECKGITDLFMKGDPAKEIALAQGFEPDCSVYIVSGICKDCISKKQAQPAPSPAYPIYDSYRSQQIGKVGMTHYPKNKKI